MAEQATTTTGQPLSMTQLAAVVARHFPPEARATAVAISWHESRGNPNALNDKNNTPPGSRDRGLWQINSYWNPSVSDQCAFDPECSTAWAAAEYKARGWKAWATFKRGAYRPFLEQAEAAVEQAGTVPAAGTVAGIGWGPIGDVVDAGKSAAGAVIPDSVGDAFGFVGRAFQALTSPEFWKRIAKGQIGIALIIAAIVFIKRDTIGGAITGGATGGGAGAAVGAAQGEQAAATKKAADKAKDVSKDGAKASPQAAGAVSSA